MSDPSPESRDPGIGGDRGMSEAEEVADRFHRGGPAESLLDDAYDDAARCRLAGFDPVRIVASMQHEIDGLRAALDNATSVMLTQARRQARDGEGYYTPVEMAQCALKHRRLLQ